MSSKGRSNEAQPLLHPTHLENQTAPLTTTPLPKAQLTALCIARLSDPISYTQIFPYINEFLITLHVTDDPSRIGFYSGIVESTSSVAQVITIFHWAKSSDILGRRPIILVGTLGLAVVSLLLGLCRTFTQILVVRAITGLLAGNASVFQAVLAELTDSTNQASAYPIYGCIYPLGSTVGPLIGGFFSNMATKYPDYFGFDFLEEHPYFMPGIICALLASLGFILTYLFLEETLPSKRNGNSANSATMGVRELLAIPRIRTLGLSSFALAFLGTGHTVVFVLFCYTPIEQGGLAFSVSEIGYTLALSSAIFVGFQLFLMRTLLRTFDIARMYIFCMAVWPFTFILVPFLNIIARMGQDSEPYGSRSSLSAVFLWSGITLSLTCSRVACLAYSNNQILVRSNSPSPSSLGAANGLNQFIMALARCVSPAFVSAVFALSVDNNILGGHFWVLVMTLISALGYFVSRPVENPDRHE
ncbi:major facilitator superfamily domain-containing protein [Mycena olivaceomarginata]|nr:major facilitator superfamily domain-containing protein [Mycena olivaceomarginata]